MSYGKTKTLELEILGLRGKQLVLVDLHPRVDSSQVRFLKIREISQNIYKPWVLFP
jgi:hypothetical protein